VPRHFCPTLTKFGIPRHIFTEFASVEFHGNSIIGSHAAIRGETDMTKVRGAFRQ